MAYIHRFTQLERQIIDLLLTNNESHRRIVLVVFGILSSG